MRAMRYKKTCLCLLMLFLLLLPVTIVSSAEYTKGIMTSSVSSHERLHFTPLDKVLVNLGMNEGMIKGDLLQITDERDTGLSSTVGSCAMVLVDRYSGLCEIVNVSKEIGKGNVVYAPKIRQIDSKLYPPVYALLYHLTNRYEPHRKITVYVHNIFDNSGNVTRYSQRIKSETEQIMSQKPRIRVRTEGALSKPFTFYPQDFDNSRSRLKAFMDQEKVDVFVTGNYSIENGLAGIRFYVYDRAFGAEMVSIDTRADSQEDMADAGAIVTAFKPVEVQEPVTCVISYNERTESISKYGKREVIAFEADGNAFHENELKARDFNIIAPTDVVILIDNERVNETERGGIVTRMDKGTHTITVEFRRGYYQNTSDALAYISHKVIRKDVSLTLKKDGDVYVTLDLNPAYDALEPIGVKVFKDVSRVRSQIKAIGTVRSDRTVEAFVD